MTEALKPMWPLAGILGTLMELQPPELGFQRLPRAAADAPNPRLRRRARNAQEDLTRRLAEVRRATSTAVSRLGCGGGYCCGPPSALISAVAATHRLGSGFGWAWPAPAQVVEPLPVGR